MALPDTLKLPVDNKLPVALIDPAVNKLPTVALPVADNIPAVNMLPPVTLPVAVISPVVVKLPPLILPLAVIVPNILTPYGENTAILPTVLTDIVTLAFAAAIFKLLPPFTTLDTEVIMPVN